MRIVRGSRRKGHWLQAAVFVAGFLACNAVAQPTMPTTESVTVTGTKDVEAAVRKFVKTMTAPTRVADKIARWREDVCPITFGLRPEAVKIVTERVRDIATQVSAPVSKDACKPNIEIVFTTTPQALLDTIRVKEPIWLGYHTNLVQAGRLATVTRPIQSWYATQTQDLNLNRTLDRGRCVGKEPNYEKLTMPCATAYAVIGNRLGNGVSSDFNRVLVVAEPAKLLDYEVGTLADYIAMLALSQTQPPDSCQDMPSILNLLVTGCDRTAKALTSGDIAYLQALYKMAPTATFGVQRDQVMSQMDRSLEGQQ